MELSRPAARAWVDRWDEQQEFYAPHRTERWDAVVTAAGRWAVPGRPLLDLGCGPGSLTARLASAYPASPVVGVDADPLLIGLAEAAFGTRSTWVVGRFDRELPSGAFACAVSSTTLHYLDADALGALLRRLRGVVPALINADCLPDAGDVLAKPPAAPWVDWWDAARADPRLWRLRQGVVDLPGGDHRLRRDEFFSVATDAGWRPREVWRRGASSVVELVAGSR